MCGRYTLTYPDAESLADALGAELGEDAARAYQPHYNAAPGTVHVVLQPGRAARRELVAATWGLALPGPKASGGLAPINARSESVRTKPAFRAGFQERRCVVPATGFFEWTGPKNARRPIWFHPPEPGVLCFAGVYEIALGQAGEPRRSFAILTTPANDLVAEVHDRMPAILAPGDVDRWLTAGPEEAGALLRPAPAGLLVGTAMSPRANSVAHDDPACLEPWTEPVVRGEQLPLFGSKRR
jgi:putative SOS response-associated peptidase YedK